MTSSHLDHQSPYADRLELHIDPDDADQAFAAGVQFARALAGADSGGFMVALGEQVALVQSGITTVGFPATVARLAAEAFEAGARVEWKRIGGPVRPAAWGTA